MPLRFTDVFYINAHKLRKGMTDVRNNKKKERKAF